ncbi:hypothetical protein V1478_000262 [Vespula squamosa]|uniref:Uncharacterized protein n=1 Tax=Vespula squamosa TaxID=30214 RepID=A0ABD2C507_VESSQ
MEKHVRYPQDRKRHSNLTKIRSIFISHTQMESSKFMKIGHVVSNPLNSSRRIGTPRDSAVISDDDDDDHDDDHNAMKTMMRQ